MAYFKFFFFLFLVVFSSCKSKYFEAYSSSQIEYDHLRKEMMTKALAEGVKDSKPRFGLGNEGNKTTNQIKRKNGPFDSSQEVFCFQYVKTTNDGIISKRKDYNEIVFVNFQKDMMGKSYFSSAKSVGIKMIEDPTYYDNLAREDLVNNERIWNSSPSSEDAKYGVTIYKFNSEYSTDSKYSYIEYYKQNESYWEMDRFIGHSANRWLSPKWRDRVYTFSIDRSEMIVWSKSDPENIDYYKRIDPHSLKPNLDFLN